jgi:copper chaperone NosL
MKPIHLILALTMFIFAFAACASPIDPTQPPAIVYGEDVCDRCGMIIADERFAAGVVVEVGTGHYEHRIFDDIGDMFAYLHDEGADLYVVSIFVHDYHSKAWINAEDATFVQAESLQSPMGFGLAAFADKAAAESQALSWAGEILDFGQAQQFAQMTKPHHVHTH